MEQINHGIRGLQRGATMSLQLVLTSLADPTGSALLLFGEMFALIALAQVLIPYGLPVALETAKQATAPALAEARKNNWTMAVAIVDTAGNLVYFEKMDGTQTASVNVSIEKARSAVLFKRPTKSFQDTVAQGGAGLRMLALP